MHILSLIQSPASKVQTPTDFAFKGTRKSYQIVHLFQMFVTYVKHLSHKEIQREMIVATMLDVLKARASTNPKALYLDQTYQTIPDFVEKHKSRLIKLPTSELDDRTHERKACETKEAQWQCEYGNAIRGPNDKKLCGEFRDLPARTLGVAGSLAFMRNAMQLQKGRHKRQHLTLISKRCQMQCDLWLGRPERQDASKSVSAKQKRPLFESDEDDDEDLKSSKTKSMQKRCELDGDKEAAVSEMKECRTAADVGH